MLIFRAWPTCGLQDYPVELRDWSEVLTVGAWVWAKRRVILKLNIIKFGKDVAQVFDRLSRVLLEVYKSKKKKKKMSAGYQLYYFPGRGRAEMARWAFAVTKIDFEDVRLSVEEWAKEKACKLRKLEVS